MKIGITGSLSSGKSSVANILSKNKNLLFSADKEVKYLYSNRQFKKKLKNKFKLKRHNVKQEISTTKKALKQKGGQKSKTQRRKSRKSKRSSRKRGNN